MTNNSESKLTMLKAFMKGDVSLTVNSDNKSANSGHASLVDIPRSTFVINDKKIRINNEDVKQLREKHKNLEKIENGDYRPFVKELFKEIFIRIKSPVLISSILDEMVTNCNQAGYEYMHYILGMKFYEEYGLACNGTKKIQIRCKSSNSVNFCISSTLDIKDPNSNMRCSISFSVKFTLEADKDIIRYKDIEMSVIFPKKLERHIEDQANENLVNIIKEFLYELFEIIFSRCKVIEKDDSIEVIKRGNKIEITSKSNSISEDIQTLINGVKIDKPQKTAQLK